MKQIVERIRRVYAVTGENQITCHVSKNFEMVDVDEDELKENITTDNHNYHVETIENCTQCSIPPREKWDLGCQVHESLWSEEIHPSCPVIKQHK
jgi:tRNA threonylcarbamoyladenosine modification (KEOPS) complex Cgi121 subunit